MPSRQEKRRAEREAKKNKHNKSALHRIASGDEPEVSKQSQNITKPTATSTPSQAIELPVTRDTTNIYTDSLHTTADPSTARSQPSSSAYHMVGGIAPEVFEMLVFKFQMHTSTDVMCGAAGNTTDSESSSEGSQSTNITIDGNDQLHEEAEDNMDMDEAAQADESIVEETPASSPAFGNDVDLVCDEQLEPISDVRGSIMDGSERAHDLAKDNETMDIDLLLPGESQSFAAGIDKQLEHTNDVQDGTEYCSEHTIPVADYGKVVDAELPLTEELHFWSEGLDLDLVPDEESEPIILVKSNIKETDTNTWMAVEDTDMIDADNSLHDKSLSSSSSSVAATKDADSTSDSHSLSAGSTSDSSFSDEDGSCEKNLRDTGTAVCDRVMNTNPAAAGQPNSLCEHMIATIYEATSDFAVLSHELVTSSDMSSPATLNDVDDDVDDNLNQEALEEIFVGAECSKSTTADHSSSEEPLSLSNDLVPTTNDATIDISSSKNETSMLSSDNGFINDEILDDLSDVLSALDDDPDISNCLLTPEDVQLKEASRLAENEDWLREQESKDPLSLEKCDTTEQEYMAAFDAFFDSLLDVVVDVTDDAGSADVKDEKERDGEEEVAPTDVPATPDTQPENTAEEDEVSEYLPLRPLPPTCTLSRIFLVDSTGTVHLIDQQSPLYDVRLIDENASDWDSVASPFKSSSMGNSPLKTPFKSPFKTPLKMYVLTEDEEEGDKEFEQVSVLRIPSLSKDLMNDVEEVYEKELDSDDIEVASPSPPPFHPPSHLTRLAATRSFLSLTNALRSAYSHPLLPSSVTVSAILASNILPHTIRLGRTSLAAFLEGLKWDEMDEVSEREMGEALRRVKEEGEVEMEKVREQEMVKEDGKGGGEGWTEWVLGLAF